eukprot:m.147504 g.147504  ORF g.147504 m.147504 type:complete len:108 (-) comp14183_c0_seq3:71-394(-)
MMLRRPTFHLAYNVGQEKNPAPDAMSSKGGSSTGGSNSSAGSSGGSGGSGGGGGGGSAAAAPEPTIVSGWQYHTYAQSNYGSERYAYIGKGDSGTPEFLDYGAKGSK